MHIPVSRERVYTALDTAEGRAAFWAESAAEIDGHIHFDFINGVTYRSRVLERRMPARWAIEYFGGPAIFELTDDGAGGTDLLLTHEDIGGADWVDVHAGWLNVLFPLKAWLTFRVDLRNHDPQRTWDAGYADQ
jgi:hypothetical protein